MFIYRLSLLDPMVNNYINRKSLEHLDKIRKNEERFKITENKRIVEVILEEYVKHYPLLTTKKTIKRK